MSLAPTPTSSACSTPTCLTSTCSPACEPTSTCYLSVIGSTCQCPIASCVSKLDFDTGSDNGNTSNTSSSSGSIAGPVIGTMALGAVAIIAFFVIRRRKRRRRLQLMLGQDDSLDSFSKRWHSTNSIDSAGKDVIRIAYIPSMIGETSVVTPEPSMQHGGVFKPNFLSLKDDDRNKHSSVSSVDEAVMMSVTSKATPQVMRLNAIKGTQSNFIQRSNTLNNSNSVKRRSKSQQKQANKGIGMNPSPLAGAQSSDEGSGDDSDMEEEGDPYFGTIGARRPSGDDETNPFMTEAELAMLTNVPSFTNDTHNNNNNNNNNNSFTRTPSSYSDNPFLSLAESKAISSASISRTSSPPATPMSDTTTVFASLAGNQQYDPLSDLAGGGVTLRPWAKNETTAVRDSTFSTMSDGRSTRGDGEEIMIFWDGSRDSRSNL